jgi:hypothetical protein
MKKDNTYFWKRTIGDMLNQFTISGITYTIDVSYHADGRSDERNIDMFKIVGAILSLGEKRIKEYTENRKCVLIMDNDNKFSVVFKIKGHRIIIITVIDKANCYAKNGTDIVKL